MLNVDKHQLNYRFWAEVYLLAQIAPNEPVQQPITKWQMLVKKLVPVHVTRLTGTFSCRWT